MKGDGRLNVIKEVKKAQKGNAASFEKLIHIYKLIMYRIAKTILKKDEDCADAIQETILKAFTHISELREPAYFKTWLCRILMNECNQILRKSNHLIQIDEWIEPHAIDSGFEDFELELMLDQLSQEDAQILKLFHIEDLSVRDLANIFDAPENIIKTRLRRARQKMQELWLKQEEGLTWKNGKNN